MNHYSDNNFDITIDKKKTEELYSEKECNDLIYLNYINFCKTLTKEEKELFNTFCIDPFKLNSVMEDYYPLGNYLTIGMDRHKNLEYFIRLPFIGRYDRYPSDMVCKIEDFIPENHRDVSFNVGRFNFSFEPTDTIFDNKKGKFECINLHISITIPWALKEKCPLRIIYPYQIFRRIKRWNEIRIYSKNYTREYNMKLINLFESNNIKYKFLSKKEVKKYRYDYINSFVESDKIKRAKEITITTRHCNQFLWHIFGFNLVKHQEKDKAIQCIKELDINCCYLFFEDNDKLYLLEGNINNIIDNINEYDDVHITDINFKYEYVHTHESECGPYFYKK